MKTLALLALLVVVACGESQGPSSTGTNFSITNRSSDPATVMLHQNTWDGAIWTENPVVAYQITVQPGVCTDTTLNLEAVTASVATASDTVALDVFGLYESNTYSVSVIVESGNVLRAARQRGQGCV